jgi:hypothetical protein
MLKGKTIIMTLIVFSLLTFVSINQYVAAQILQQDSTSTVLSINPTPVNTGTQTTVTATVSDTTVSYNTPSGTVTFSASRTGGIFDITSCTTSNNMLACTVIYTAPDTAGTIVITGTYNGDLTHKTSSGTTSLSVNTAVSGPPVAPQPPTNLSATTFSSSQIDLRWDEPTNDGGATVTGYQIERSDDDMTWYTVEPNTGSSTTTYSDTGLPSSTAYYYRVSAINSAGSSSPSNSVTATTNSQSIGITVYAHRIPASYWDPCFASECSAGTGPGATMYFGLYDSSGKLVQEGFADEHGYTFSNLNPSATYYVYPSDCGYCHITFHDVVFEYWGDNHSSERPRAATVGANLHAWYSCSNNCAGLI